MTLQQLEYVMAVYRCKHFAKAADYCNVTQPTLSSMIQKLEEELGVKIFDRRKQPIKLLLKDAHHRASLEYSRASKATEGSY